MDGQFRITEVWAWTCIDDDDTEGVIGMRMGGGWMPFVAADKNRVESLRPHAMRIANELGKPVKLKRFTQMDVVEEVFP